MGKPTDERFWAKVDTSGGPDACWPWMAARRPEGYGAFRLSPPERRTVKAHRYVMGEPDGCVLHHCDNPPCCNPTHLYVGTQADNVRDMFERGRQSDYTHNPRGSCNSKAKLTEEIVLAMRFEYEAGDTTHRELAERYGLAIENIQKALTGKTWAHVGGPLLPKRRPGRPARKAT